jgi:osmotically inducible protein OsmC
MTKLEKVLYTAKAYTTGGRGGGASRTDEGQSAIFLSVIKSCRRQKEGQVAGRSGHRRRSGLGHDRRGLRPSSRLNVSLPGIEREVAQELVDAAEQLRGLR